MLMRHAPLRTAIAVCAGLAATHSFGFDSVYTTTDPAGPDCRALPDGASWRCRGPNGYTAVFSDEGNVVAVEYGPAGEEKSLGGLQWRGARNPIGPAVEWRLADRTPFAAILRIKVLDENERARQRLLIAKVGPTGSCRIADIDARQSNANALARWIADTRGPSYMCGR